MPTPSGFSSATLSNTLCGNADLVQAERQRQPADAAAGDKYGHDTPSILAASWHGGAAVGNCEKPVAWAGGWTVEDRAVNFRLSS